MLVEVLLVVLCCVVLLALGRSPVHCAGRTLEHLEKQLPYVVRASVD